MSSQKIDVLFASAQICEDDGLHRDALIDLRGVMFLLSEQKHKTTPPGFNKLLAKVLKSFGVVS